MSWPLLSFLLIGNESGAYPTSESYIHGHMLRPLLAPVTQLSRGGPAGIWEKPWGDSVILLWTMVQSPAWIPDLLSPAELVL